MIFCNPVPIAAACSLDRNTVEDVLSAYAQAVAHLIQKGNSLDIGFGFVHIWVKNKNLKYSYDKNFIDQLNDVSY